ncbi:THAP domain-containing protein 2, partial [Acropora cervicornis]
MSVTELQDGLYRNVSAIHEETRKKLFTENAAKMVEKCVVYGCSNSKNKQKGISMRKIPSDSDPRAEVRRRRQRWIKFVNQTRKHWIPGKTSSICSVHFKHEDFTRPFNSNLKRVLREDEFGVCHVRSAKERMRNLNSLGPAIEGEPSTGHQDTTLELNLSCIGPGTSTSENTTVDLDVSCIEPGTSVSTSSSDNTTVELNVSCTEPGTSTSENTTVDVNVS